MKKTALIGLATVSIMVLAGCGSTTGGGGSSGSGSSGSETGVTATEIHLGATTPLTGPAASYSEITTAQKAYFDYINDQGGINGRKIKYTVYDDGYDPSKTVPLIQKLVNEDKVFAIAQVVGTAPMSAVYKRLNAQKIPVLASSGSSTFVSPTLPYVTALLPNYPVEAKLLAEYLKKAYPDKKVGILNQNDDAGQDFVKAFTTVLGSSVVGKTSYEQTDSSVSAQVTNLQNSGAQVVGFNGTPKFLALALKAARGQAWDALFVSTGPAVDASLLKLAGPAAEGLVTATGFKSAANESDPEVKKANDIVRKYAPGIQPDTTTMWGIAAGEIFVAALKAAGKNLTRESLVKAIDNLTVEKGVWYGTVKLTPTQHDYVQCEQIEKVTGGVLVPVGDVVCPS